jgi:hypothetical protein
MKPQDRWSWCIVAPSGMRLDGWRWSVALTCPACGAGTPQWAEAGHVPGYRVCDHCGRGWEVSFQRDGEALLLTLSIPETSTGLEWSMPSAPLTHEERVSWSLTGSGANPDRARSYAPRRLPSRGELRTMTLELEDGHGGGET